MLTQPHKKLLGTVKKQCNEIPHAKNPEFQKLAIFSMSVKIGFTATTSKQEIYNI
jgi:hypothetical protein